jgi:hypothetical protein
MPSGLSSPACSAVVQEFFRFTLRAVPAGTAAPGAAIPPGQTGPPPTQIIPRTRPASEPSDHRLPSRTRPPRQFQDLAHLEVDHAVAAILIRTHRSRSHSAAAVLGRSNYPPPPSTATTSLTHSSCSPRDILVARSFNELTSYDETTFKIAAIC